MYDSIPISEFQRHTKDAFQQATKDGYKYVTNHNDGVAVVVDIKLFEKLQNKAKNKAPKLHIDDFKGYFGSSDESSLELEAKAFKLWMKN